MPTTDTTRPVMRIFDAPAAAGWRPRSVTYVADERGTSWAVEFARGQERAQVVGRGPVPAVVAR